jgi:hypothetical protein
MDDRRRARMQVIEDLEQRISTSRSSVGDSRRRFASSRRFSPARAA